MRIRGCGVVQSTTSRRSRAINFTTKLKTIIVLGLPNSNLLWAYFPAKIFFPGVEFEKERKIVYLEFCYMEYWSKQSALSLSLPPTFCLRTDHRSISYPSSLCSLFRNRVANSTHFSDLKRTLTQKVLYTYRALILQNFPVYCLKAGLMNRLVSLNFFFLAKSWLVHLLVL